MGLSNVSNMHLKHKDSLFETFVGYFNREPHLQRLANVYADPQDSCNLVTNFILLTRCPKSKQKFDVLNSALVNFVKYCKMTKTAAGRVRIPSPENFSQHRGYHVEDFVLVLWGVRSAVQAPQ